MRNAGRRIRRLAGITLCLAATAGKPVVILPGFPTSAIFTFHEFVAPVIAQLSGVTLKHREQPVEATEITGELRVRNREVYTPSLRGRLLGGPVRLSVATTVQRNGDLETQLTAEGELLGAQLVPAAHLPLNANLSGSADWRGFLTLQRAAAGDRPARGTLRLSSDLRGLAVGLPEPFGAQLLARAGEVALVQPQ